MPWIPQKPVFENNGIDVHDHFKLVRYWAAKYGAINPVEDDERYAAGCIGLIKAARYFNPALGYQFSTYASRLIKAYIRMIMFPRKPRLDFASLEGLSERGDGGFDVSISYEPNVLDEISSDDAVKTILSVLDSRHADIVRLRTVNGLTFHEIGQAVGGVTRQRARQIYRKAMRKLRTCERTARIADKLVA